MIRVYKRECDVITVSVTSTLKEVTVASSSGISFYSAPANENGYGSMGSYINSWMKAVEGLKPVVVMD